MTFAWWSWRTHFLGVLAALTVAGSANAERIVVADVSAPAELEAAAGSMTLVLRSYVGSESQRVSRTEIAEAVAKVGGGNRRALAIESGKVEAALGAIGADKWLAGELERVGAILELRLTAFDRSGTAVGEQSVRAPLGDYNTLAGEAVTAGAALVGAVVMERPKTGSFASTAAAGVALADASAGDLAAAAERLGAAPVRLGSELSAVAELAVMIAADTSAPLDLRMNATLIAGDAAAAEALANENKRDPRSLALRARVRMGLLDHRAATRLLTKAKRATDPFVVLARAALAGELGRADELSRSYAVLLRGDPYVPALALAVRLRPGALGVETEALLVAAARRIADKHPSLAAVIAARALRGGATDPEIFELLDPFAITDVELKELKDAVESIKDQKVRARLSAELAIREGRIDDARKAARLASNLDPDNPRAAWLAKILAESEGDVGGDTASAVPDDRAAQPAALADEKKAAAIKELADDLVPILGAFPTLVPEMGRVVLVPRVGNRELPFWPTRVHPDRLRIGLEAALAAEPYRLSSATEVGEMPAKPTRRQLAQLAKDYNAGGVLVYGVRTDGFDAKLTLLLYSGLSVTTEVYTETLRGAKDHGVVSWNPLFVGVSLALFALLILWLVWRLVRGAGSVRVQLKNDPSAERPSFSILLSKRNRCPVVTDPSVHVANVTAEAKAGRYSAHNIGAVTEFEAIAPGSWFVHVYGTYEKAGEVRCLPAVTEGTKVRRARASVVTIDLIPKETEFHILVSGEGGPASGAEVWLSTQPSKRYSADVGGKTVVFAPPGDHTIHVSFRGQEVTRKVSAFGSKVQTLHLNMIRERRLAEVSEGIEFAAGSADDVVSAVSDTAFPPLDEATATAMPAAAGDDAGPSVESFLRAAGSATEAPTSGALAGLRRYRAGSELGRGAMGVVYHAIDQVLDRPVALKVMSDALRAHPSAAKMFQQEAKALAALNHPNVVAVYDQGRDGEHLFMVMELVEGQTLEDVLIARGKLPLEEAANIGEQLGRSLSYAHSRRVIHRDIKPGNVFLTEDGSVKLGDFGLARVLNEVQIKKTEIKGTPLYMAPEQIRGSDIDFRADIYALGCTMYEVLAGRPPFIDGEILWHHIYTEPEPLSTHVAVPAPIEQLIMKCIAKEKSERISSADRISEVFGAIRRGQ